MELENLFPSKISKIPPVTHQNSPEQDLERCVADISTMTEDDARSMCRACSVIVHTAGLVHQPGANAELYESTNVRATRLLAEAAAECGAEQFIFLSSSSVYGNRATNMATETDECCRDTPYGISKIESEEMLRANPPAPSTVILRPSLVFGEGDRGNMLSLIRQATSGKYFLVGSGSAQKSLIYARDLANAIILLVKSPKKQFELFNIANPDPVTVKQLSEAILLAAGKEPKLMSMPPWLISVVALIANTILGRRSPLSPERLAKLTRDNSVSVKAFVDAYGFRPEFELQQALANEIEWIKQQAG
jgi:nucleoside-diphosphate-sugar epimerase